MTLDELLQKAATEPARSEERDVSVAPAVLLREAAQRGGMPLTEFLADPRRTVERRTLRLGHVFAPPSPVESIEEWMRERPGLPLPADLRELLVRVNGIHLWADLDTGRSYEGLAPLEEWDLARRKLWGSDDHADWLGDEYLAISYHADSSAFVVLKASTGEYFLMDPCGADESCRIGSDVGALLDWLWDHRIA